ncbi:hypothetical protein AAHC03_016714 [Spirometra sp. Aus1]
MWMHECLACPSAQSAGVDAWMRHLAEAHVMPTEWISERAARLVGPAARTPYTLITESKKKRCRGTVPRPLNSFMIFAQHIRRNVLRVFGKASNSIISRQLGEIWRSLPRPVKERYDAEAARLEVCETNAQQGGSACICENHCQPQSRQRYFSSPNAPLLTQSAVFARTASCSLPAFHYQSAQTRGSAVLSTQNVNANHETTVRGIQGSECSRWNYASSESLSQTDSGIFSPIESDALAWPDSSVIDPVHNELHQHDRTIWKVGCEQDTGCSLEETWGQIVSDEVLDFRPLSTEAEMVLGPTLQQPPPSPTTGTPLRTPIRPTDVCQMSDRESCCPHLSNLLSADMEPIVRTDSSLLQSDWSVYA